MGDVLAHMVLNDLVHQAIDCAAGGGDLLQDRRASGVCLKSPLDRRHLPCDPSDTGDEMLLLGSQMCHRILPYSILSTLDRWTRSRSPLLWRSAAGRATGGVHRRDAPNAAARLVCCRANQALARCA